MTVRSLVILNISPIALPARTMRYAWSRVTGAFTALDGGALTWVMSSQLTASTHRTIGAAVTPASRVQAETHIRGDKTVDQVRSSARASARRGSARASKA